MLKQILFAGALALFGAVTGVQAQEAAAEASAASLYNDGLAKAKAGEYESALDLMEQALEKADTTVETDVKVIRLAQVNGGRAAYALGLKLQKAGKTDEALAIYERGVAINPDYYANYRGQAEMLEAKGQLTDAVATYIKAGGIAEKSEKDADKAAPLFSKAENMVAVAWGEKKWNDVKAMAQAYVDNDQESADVHYYRAAALKETGDTAEAIKAVDRAIEMAGTNDASKYYMLKGQTLEAMGQNDAAVNAYKKVTDAKYSERAQYKVKELGGGR